MKAQAPGRIRRVAIGSVFPAICIALVFILPLLVGCSSATESPTSPDLDVSVGGAALYGQDRNGPYRLWWEGQFFIDADHEHVDVIPSRDMHLHLNSLKFLEDYCKNCLQITSIRNNGDSTIDLAVRITHPFNGFPQYTGFDVKGIIMFNGSHEFTGGWNVKYLPLYPQIHRASWRLLGDPELLNADGYSYRWSPWYESGSDMPIFNYWTGKYSNGTPTANVNGYLDFYSNENRHMFETGKNVTRVYHIWLPPGPVVAGYAVEACWEPPTVTPVTDPASDFPITANQPEAYHFHCVLNDGKPMNQEDSCCHPPLSIEEQRAEMNFWYLVPETSPDSFWVQTWCPEISYYLGVTVACDAPPDWRCLDQDYSFYREPNGTYQFIAFEWHVWEGDPKKPKRYVAVDLFEIVLDYL